MKVVATAKGYLGSIREPGDVFEVADGAKGSWFTPLPEEPKAADKPKGKGRAPDPKDAVEDEPII
jgi:hypothetical protein